MKNIINALEAQEKKRLNNFITDLEKIDDLKNLNVWQYTTLLPRGKKLDNMTLIEAKAYLVKRKEKAIYKSIERQVKQVLAISKGGELIDAKISLEWKKSKMWGSNPKAECVYSYRDENGNFISNRVVSGSVSGCGYDKQSTAVAECLNQINEVLKPMYLLKNDNLDKENRDVFGYGAGYGLTPSIEGGVGVSCYPNIFDKLGYEFKTIASGKTFDVFTISKNS
jgi:hypothetical protein